jgi:hypothetical protein
MIMAAIVALATTFALAQPTAALTPSLASTTASMRSLSTMAPSSRRAWLGAGAAAIALLNQPSEALAGERTAATLDRVEYYEAPKVSMELVARLHTAQAAREFNKE